MTSVGNSVAKVNGSSVAAVHEAAREAYTAGLCIIPPAEDGTKRPLPNARGTWDVYKQKRPTIDELKKWYPGRSGIGIVTGPASGGVECWDFDDRSAYEKLVATAGQCGLAPVVDRIESGYCDDTPSGGVRWLIRYPDEVERTPGSGIKLARRPKEEHEKQHPQDGVKVLIELPAFAITAPTNGSVHPSGKPYMRRTGSFSSIASYTAEERDALLELARSFDAMPRRAAERQSGRHPHSARPGDDYSHRTTWAEVLGPHGWTIVYTRDDTTYWRRPGKTIGISATTNYGGGDLLFVFTSSTEFEADKSYSRFAAYTILNYAGDFKAAARELATGGFGIKGSMPAPEVLLQVGDYRETEDGIEWQRQTREGAVWVRLTNFRARITSDMTLDDDVETTKMFEITATLYGREHRLTIASAQFGTLNWALERLGAKAIVQPGQGTAARARAAIQFLSGDIPEQRVYTHTGWRKIDEEWWFLNGSGALGATGVSSAIFVSLPEQLGRFALPEIEEGALAQDVAASLRLLGAAPDHATVPLLGAIYRAVLGGADLSVHISGFTGAQKTELAALAQQHFGPTMHARALPTSWELTANKLEMLASAAKDVVLVIDDYVLPHGGTSVDRARLNAKADRVLRAQGNNSARGRLRADASMKPERPPRGLIVSTGEEVPGGLSLRARMIIIELQAGTVDQEKLTMAQREAADGVYARAMAGYIRWLAPRLDDVRGNSRR